jgi:hypothetical protein
LALPRFSLLRKYPGVRGSAPGVATGATLALVAACAQVPALDARLTNADRTAPYPALIDIAPVLAAAEARAPMPDLSALDARIARLSARAAILRAPVLSASDRARLGL